MLLLLLLLMLLPSVVVVVVVVVVVDAANSTIFSATVFTPTSFFALPGPTMKLKRNEVLKKYSSLVDDLYKEGAKL